MAREYHVVLQRGRDFGNQKHYVDIETLCHGTLLAAVDI